MRAFRNCGTVLALLLAGIVCPHAVLADELLVMPYSCKVVSGRPMLTPSEDQGHPVIGRREQQEFRACSPADPRLCRRWNVHRFDLDCGGVRVPWVDVAAAAGAGREGRAFVEDGHFELEMPARWSLEPDAPCARGGDFQGSGFRRFCDERLARMPRVTVAMPRGFAPMLGIDGIFVKDHAPRGAMADATPSRGEALPERIENPQRTKPSPQVTPEAVKKAPQKERPSPEEPVQSAKTTTPEHKKTANAAAPSEPTKTDLSAAGSTTAGAAPIIPQIINGANGPSMAQGADHRVTETSALPDRSSPPAGSDTTAAQSDMAGSNASVPDRLAMTEREDASFKPTASLGEPLAEHATAITVGTLGVLTMLTLLFVFRRGRSVSVPALSRDLSAVSLGLSASNAGGALAVVPQASRELDASPPPSSGSLALLGDAMPRTRAEALEVLGMGVAPEFNEAAIKKIIDGLRLSWHPDHARDAGERARRELRIKQINAAWDIISARRPS